ncbi:putative nuclear transport factor 2, partial [Trichinella nelsoni]
LFEMVYNPDFENVGMAFVQHFYNLFDVSSGDQRKASIADLYDNENSYVTFEGNQIKGKNAVLEMYGGLPFRSIQRVLTKVDCQPLEDGSILVVVLGQLKTDDDPPQGYNHTFILRQHAGHGQYFISNEVFRLSLHNL